MTMKESDSYVVVMNALGDYYAEQISLDELVYLVRKNTQDWMYGQELVDALTDRARKIKTSGPRKSRGPIFYISNS